MKDIDRLFSLLPYLDEHQEKFYLKIPLISGNNNLLEKTAFPFSIISDIDPITRLIEAELVTDAGSKLEKIFLLVQRDSYKLPKDELWPVSNEDIENLWQNAFSFYAAEKPGPSLILISNQINENGGLEPLLSIFYCKSRQLYFHPPCPKCAGPLQQCMDDDILAHSGLQTYSRSLKRYLYCPSCAESETGDFYVYEREQSDPHSLKDRQELIKEFGLLTTSDRDIDTHFPCTACPEHNECYGTDDKASSRIVPFSFYPFYLFAFKAMSLNALDFLSLVSGATVKELETELEGKGEVARCKCLKDMHLDSSLMTPFLFDSDERYFLEVLYLKLSFLGEMLQGISSKDGILKHPDLRLSIDRTWVTLHGHDSLLPFFWNFKVNFIDIFGHRVDEKAIPQLSGSTDFFYMGLVWFYALLTNKRQGVSKLYQLLKELMDRSVCENDFSFEALYQVDVYPGFHPDNIFWNPERKTVKDNWFPLWGKALALGWSLLEVALNNAGFSLESLIKQLEDLRTEVKNSMFSEATGVVQNMVEEDTELEGKIQEGDEAILGILENVYRKWKKGIEKTYKESLETVIIPGEGPEKEGITAAPVNEGKEEFMETVILSPEGLKKAIPSPEVQHMETGVVPETVIISTKSDRDSTVPEHSSPFKEREELNIPGKKKKKTEDKDVLTETIILRPERIQKKDKNEK